MVKWNDSDTKFKYNYLTVLKIKKAAYGGFIKR
jgi:hypothetical protein